jgi:hypothetical protein
MQLPLATTSAAGSSPRWAYWVLLLLHLTTAIYCGAELLVSGFAGGRGRSGGALLCALPASPGLCSL